MTRSATVEGNVTVTGVAATVAVASDRGHHVVAPTTVAATRWVLDPDDDHGCVRALLALHDLAVGVVVCPAAPGSPWPLLAGHVLVALGKDRRALDAAGPRHRVPELLALWLRAERVQHLVVLRAHLLSHATLVELDRLATDAGVTVWAVAHGDHGVDHTARRAPSAAPVQWTAAVALLTAATATGGPRTASAPELYGTVRDLARRAGRAWRLYTERTLRLPRDVRPNCELGVLLQNLTIDAHDRDELLLRLHATRAGLHDEGLHLALPALEHDARLLAYLGPRFNAETMARLRRLACPTAAGALTLALATDHNAPWLAETRTEWTDPHARHVCTYTGTWRIPPRPARCCGCCSTIAQHTAVRRRRCSSTGTERP
ncbi:hypothetical protein SAMN05216207_105923 [Pseudonocardia ammonioxydans]|uniref:Uncharacterized protein n=1 Tax=Pseudonocardia ammonioxydans TaxID=260086 RepID=A0A1I5H885_PSUAM|nr:hypothetical protein [Pseudonocardia ammonioxydans]SFO44413.1 hypothetical protein SAMN05216207_105923 [Pseudonocardia ammonioxydans]